MKFAPDNWYMFRYKDRRSSRFCFLCMVVILLIRVPCALFTLISGIFIMNSYTMLLFSDCWINFEYSRVALRFKKYPTQIIERTLEMKKMKKIDLLRKNNIELKTTRFNRLTKKLIPFQVKKVWIFDRSDSLCKVSVLSLVSK